MTQLGCCQGNCPPETPNPSAHHFLKPHRGKQMNWQLAAPGPPSPPARDVREIPNQIPLGSVGWGPRGEKNIQDMLLRPKSHSWKRNQSSQRERCQGDMLFPREAGHSSPRGRKGGRKLVPPHHSRASPARAACPCLAMLQTQMALQLLTSLLLL